MYVYVAYKKSDAVLPDKCMLLYSSDLLSQGNKLNTNYAFDISGINGYETYSHIRILRGIRKLGKPIPIGKRTASGIAEFDGKRKPFEFDFDTVARAYIYDYELEEES